MRIFTWKLTWAPFRAKTSPPWDGKLRWIGTFFGSIDSIGSIGSVGSIGSIGSFGSIGSIDSIGSIGSIGSQPWKTQPNLASL